MTRDFSLALANANQWYSLWDLIVASYGINWDPTFSNGPYVPSEVCSLKTQNVTAGSHIFRTDTPNDPYAAKGFDFVGYSWDTEQASGHKVSLKDKYYSTDTVGAVINVSIIA